MEPVLQTPWHVLEDPAAPGEHLVMEALGRKLVPVWLSQEEAEVFLRLSPAAQGMRVGRLEGFLLKEAFLTALGLLGVTHVVVGYRPGQPQAVVLERSAALGEIQRHIRGKVEDA
ncbi:MAG: DUF3234 domain-containing protein [Meiothermus sp.]